MGWELRELHLPPEEDDIAKTWVEAPEFQRFFEWISNVLQEAAKVRDVVKLQDVLGQILCFAGRGLLKPWIEEDMEYEEDFDGTPPAPPPKGH